MSRPALLALFASLLITAILTSFLLVYVLFSGDVFLAACIIFIISFLVIYAILNRFVYREIRSIQKELKNQIGANGSDNSKRSKDPVKQLSYDFQQWSHSRKEEVARLKKLENYRKDFLGNVSHELKTPVFNIQGYILTLIDGGLEDKKINMDYLRRAEKSVERLIHIIEDLESITQLETGELKLEIEKFDIALLAKDVTDSMEMRSGEKNIRLTLEKYDTNPLMVMADKYRIRQVFLNLIVNSIKYGKQNGETRIIFRDAGEKIIVEVADNGIGIEKKYLHRIFERFYRVDKSRSREAGGTGLGLSIVEHIIDAHGQTISVLSTPGVGTVFSFPLKKAQ